MSEVESTCTGALIISAGSIVAAGSTTEIVASARGTAQLRAVIDGPAPDVQLALQQLTGINRVRQSPGGEPTFLIECAAAADVRRSIFQLCSARQWPLLELERQVASLEDVFHQLTMTKS